jgi:hypothetical protein
MWRKSANVMGKIAKHRSECKNGDVKHFRAVTVETCALEWMESFQNG